MPLNLSNQWIKFFKLFIITCIFLFSSIYAQAQTPDLYGGQIVLATTSDPKSFNDILAKETSTTEITNLIFEGLTTTDPVDARVIPNLADHWDVSDDGLNWTFYLRRDVFFNDGKQFTADDVVFTFMDLIFNDDIPSSARDIFTIDGQAITVEKVDDFTVHFSLPLKFAPFLRSLSQAILPKHKLEQFVKDKTFNHAWGIDTKENQIVGTGPFMLSKYQPGQRIIFKRNPYYWKKSKDGHSLPYLDKIVYLIVQNSDVTLLKFLEGSIDVYALGGKDFPLLKPMDLEKNFTIYNLGPTFGSQFLFFNQNPGVNPKTHEPFVVPYKLNWFRDKEFRQAIAYCIDKKRIIEIVKNGLGFEQDSAMGPATGYFHNPNVKKYEYNLDQAREILQKAGYKDRDGDGYIEDKDGHIVEFNLYTNSGANERIDIAGIIRYDLEKIGMKVSFKSLEFNSVVGMLTSTFDWEAIVLGLTGGIEPHFGKNVWVSSGQLHMWYPQQEEPATAWEARIDELFSQGVQELDEKKRKKIYDEYQEIVAENIPLIYTVLSANLTAVRNRFGNLRPTNLGGVLHNLEEIYIKE